MGISKEGPQGAEWDILLGGCVKRIGRIELGKSEHTPEEQHESNEINRTDPRPFPLAATTIP